MFLVGCYMGPARALIRSLLGSAVFSSWRRVRYVERRQGVGAQGLEDPKTALLQSWFLGSIV